MNKLIESFLMYINPDDRDMAEGVLEILLDQALQSERERIWREVINLIDKK